jgi:hypothetical protein
VRGSALNAFTIAEFAALSGMMLAVGIADASEFVDKEGQHCGFCSAQPMSGMAI